MGKLSEKKKKPLLDINPIKHSFLFTFYMRLAYQYQ